MKYSWVPHAQQVRALTVFCDELLYGGARGGGKTDAGLVWMVEPKYIFNPNYAGLVIRRNANDLTDWIERARKMYRPLGAKITGVQPEIRFPSGAVIRTGHLKDSSAYEKYIGHEYQKILIEELTKIPRESDYEKLIGSARSTIPNLPARVFATTNPDGPGYDWVKARWRCDITIFHNKPFSIKDPSSLQTRTRAYIPAKVEDNPSLFDNDPQYVAFLDAIKDPVLKKQWRDGSWESIPTEGAYYSEIIQSLYLPSPPPESLPPRILNYDINLLVPVDTWWDIGRRDATSIWFTQTVGNNVYIIDFYEENFKDMAHYISFVKSKPYTYADHFAPHDINVNEWGGGARLEQAKRLGVYFRVVPKISVMDGIQSARLLFSHVYFHQDNTEQGVNLLKNYRKVYDEKLLKFSDTPLHDFTSNAADAFRYLAVGWERYRKPRDKIKPKPHKSPYTTRRS